MSLFILDRKNLKLKTEGEVLVIYESGQRKGTVPIHLIDRCVIHGSDVELESGVLMKLAQHGATTMMLSTKTLKRNALVTGPLHNEAAIRLAQANLCLDKTLALHWAKTLVAQKLKKQSLLLKWLANKRPDAKKILLDASDSISTIEGNIHENTELNMAMLLGYEGAAAKNYFQGFSTVFAAELDFKTRNKRPPKDLVNVVLSLSYTMLHFQAVHVCMKVGLDPYLGFYHQPSFGRESLASDLIEPLRPSIDQWVYSLFQTHTLRPNHFSETNETQLACILGKAGRQIFYKAWELEQKKWQRWLRLQARWMAKTLKTKGELLIDSVPTDEIDF